MARKGENVYKRKDGRWEGRYIKGRRPDGKAVYGYLYAPSYRELKQKMIQLPCEYPSVLTGRQVTLSQAAVQQILFQDPAWEWYDAVLPHIKESTAIKYQNLLQGYILPYLGEQPIQTLSHETIEAWSNMLLLKGGVKGTCLSPKTVADCLAVIRGILRRCTNKGNLPLCDASAVSIKQQPKTMRVFSLNEQEQLCQYLYTHIDCQNLGILICLFTGIRIGEVCALKWGDISLTEQILSIHLTMQRIQDKGDGENKTKILISPPKSISSVRKIPLPDELVKILKLHQQQGDTYVLTGMSYKYVEPRTMQNRFQKVTKACSLEYANFHALRHTFATRCVELGFDIKSLSEILGHANVNITMNRYVHPSMELKRKNMMRLSDLIAVR